MNIERRDVGLIEVKLASGDVGTFSGYGAVFNNVDSHGDVIHKGAFADTLSEWKARGKWPKMLLQHGGMGAVADDALPIGQWTNMREDVKGLWVEGRLFALNTERGQYLYEGLKSGELDNLSIGYKTRDSEREVRGQQVVRGLKNLDVKEVSIVLSGSNDLARVWSVKSLSIDELRDLEGRLREEGLSRSDSKAAVSVLKAFLQREAGEPINAPRDEEASAADDVLKALSRLTDQTWASVFRR